jgi:dolichol-phosphate mannosyltransferase
MPREALVVVPTYNERENVDELLEGIRTHAPFADVLVVDDASPDGTAARVEELAARHGSADVLKRAGRFGIGTAYVEGFRRGLDRGYRFLFSMDADLSHEPRFLPALRAAADDADLVVGSRYMHGVSVVNWSLQRLALSVGANSYARRVTGLPLHDCTSGFQCIRREVLERIGVERLKLSGYSFLIELKYRAFRHGFRLAETPIVFTDRKFGQSKITRGEILRSVRAVWTLRLGRDV